MSNNIRSLASIAQSHGILPTDKCTQSVTAISLIELEAKLDEKCQPTFFVRYFVVFDQRNCRHGLGRYFSSGLGRYFSSRDFWLSHTPPGQIFFVKNLLIDFLVLVHTCRDQKSRRKKVAPVSNIVRFGSDSLDSKIYKLDQHPLLGACLTCYSDDTLNASYTRASVVPSSRFSVSKHTWGRRGGRWACFLHLYEPIYSMRGCVPGLYARRI